MDVALDLTWTEWHEYVFLGVDALLAAVLYSIYRRRGRVIKNITEAPTLSVGTELKELLEGVPNGEVPFAVIRGKVTDLGQTIESSSGLKAVMQVVTLNEHSYRRSAWNHWGDNVKTLHQAQNAVPFALKNLTKSGKQILVEIDNPFEAEEENLFLTVATSFNPSASSVASTVLGFFTGVAVRGVERTEEVLPVDSVVTGIGRLVRDSPSGQIKLVPPKDNGNYKFVLSTLPVESIIKKLEGRNTVLKVAIFAVASVGALVAARRARAWWSKRKLAQMREAIIRERTNVDIEGLSDIQICTVCLHNPKEIILMNCGHVCVCADCVLQLRGKCPVCRSPIVNTHPAYIV